MSATLFSAAAGVLAVVTIFWHDWIEVTGWNPDHGDGSLEAVVIIGLAVASLIVGLVARWRWRMVAAQST